MEERGLTSKQRRYAALVASGSTKVQAFRVAYPSVAGRTQASEWEGAKRVGRVPKVKAEICRLTLSHAVAQAEHVTARLLELTKDPDSSIALRAIAQWAKLTEAGLLKPPEAVSQAQNDRIIDELLSLVKADHEPEPLRTLTLKSDDNGGVFDVESEGTTIGERVPIPETEASPMRSLFPPTDQESAAQSLPAEGPEDPDVTTDEVEWRNLPGYFGKPRRVRVR
jgi:hypothetical protein